LSIFRDQVSIIGCAQFSSYFTGILVDGIKLQPDHIDVILNVVRKSSSLKSLKLINCGLLKDFPHLLGNAIAVNPTLPLTILDLSGNILDDKKSKLIINIILLINTIDILIFRHITFGEYVAKTCQSQVNFICRLRIVREVYSSFGCRP
jgi:hypothetical protein